jgi:hypothetical protein
MTTLNTRYRWFVQAALAFGCVSAAEVAHAQEAKPAQPAQPAQPAGSTGSTAASCEASYEQAQTERLAGHYISASSAALACSQIQCNQAIVRECMRLYESLQQDTPTLVFAARKAEGGELIDVKVEMDGKPVADRISGRPMAVDPGPHQFVFIEPTRGRVETTESARVGDHARVIEVTFPDPNAKAAAAAATPAAGPAPDQSKAEPASRGIPPMTFVLGGVGVVGIASFIGFRVSGVGDYNHYNSTCSPECNPADIDKVRTKFTISYVSLGVGVAGAAGAALVYVLSRGSDHSARAEAQLAPVDGGAMARLRARF